MGPWTGHGLAMENLQEYWLAEHFLPTIPGCILESRVANTQFPSISCS